MPDQSSNVHERRVLSETRQLESAAGDLLPAAPAPPFKLSVRGYERDAVDAHITTLRAQIEELRANQSPAGAVRRALDQVGDEVAGILQRAHETAAHITSTAEARAAEHLEGARQRSEETTANAAQRVRQLDLDTDRIWAERDRIVTDARDLARQLIELAEDAAERFPSEEVPPSYGVHEANGEVIDADVEGLRPFDSPPTGFDELR